MIEIPTTIPTVNPRIVEALYVEALVLADAARAQFEALREAGRADAVTPFAVTPVRRMPARPVQARADDVEITCEGLRTTTRVMHCLAWLLNHRAWFAGEISAIQLRRHGRLITHFPFSDTVIVSRLPADVAALVHQSERLYARIQRLEQGFEQVWRSEHSAPTGAIDRLRERLDHLAARI